MLKPKINSGVYESREELFLARYERLMGWALHLTDGERDRAEDLLHDAFIQFTLMGPDLEHIENVDGYLRTTLRNLHLSQLRRMTQVQHLSLSIADYDSVEIGLRSMELHTQVQVRDELRQICRYACLRKETAKAGSVLILRFFHGYYPSEIAQLMGATRSVVNDLMWIARREAKLYLSDPTAVKFMPAASGSADKTGKSFTEAEAPKTPGDLLAELREEIYRSRRGKCLSADQLQGIYGGGAPRAVDCLTLAHIVSCPSCLDAINRLVGLPPRSDRSPSDALGPDSRSRGGTLKSQFPANAKKQFHERCRQRLREVIEHQPRELLISVNGFILTSHHVSAEVNKQTLNVNLAERIGFIEVFSERGTRLMLLNVEPPPEGEAEQFAHLQLSDSRTLDVSVSFNGPWPTLDFSYYDPLFKSIEEIETVGPLLDSPSAQSEDTLRPQPGTRFNSRLGTSIKALWSTLVTNLRRIWRRQVQPSLWLRPMTITALIMLLLMAALL